MSSPRILYLYSAVMLLCAFEGSGEMIFADANEAPRIPRQVTAWMTPAFPGYTCATLYTPGSLFLVAGAAPTIMAEEIPETLVIDVTQLACNISTVNEFVNLRDAPQLDSLVVTVLPPNEQRWATGYSNGFYKVQYGEYYGWLHKSAVIPSAECQL